MIGARKRPGKPSLVALDFNNLTVRRYWPKPGDQRPAAFITHIGELKKPAGDPWQMGSDASLAILEEFRMGRLAPISDADLEEPEVA